MFKMKFLKFEIKYFYCVFTTRMESICEKKKNQQRYGLFERILSFYEKRIYTAVD